MLLYVTYDMVVFYWNKWFIIVFTPGLTSCPYLALQGAAALRRRQELKEMIAKKKAELLAKSLSSFGHGLVGEQLDSTYHVAPVAQYSFMFQWSHCILSLINFWYSHSLWAQPCSRYVNMFFFDLMLHSPGLLRLTRMPTKSQRRLMATRMLSQDWTAIKWLGCCWQSNQQWKYKYKQNHIHL